MKNGQLSALVAALLLVFGIVAGAHEANPGDEATESDSENRQAIPPLDAQITMFYYKNFDDAIGFYGDTLGLTLEFDWTWIKFYKTGPSSSVGIVAEGEGAWYDAQKKNAVMLSLVTSDVDAWYERLQGNSEVVVLKDIGEGGGIRNFMLEDPGGYAVEFFQWLKPEE